MPTTLPAGWLVMLGGALVMVTDPLAPVRV